MLVDKQTMEQYTAYVLVDIQNMYGLSKVAAEKLIKEYNFYNIIRSEPNYVMHYQPEVWAEKIYQKKSPATV